MAHSRYPIALGVLREYYGIDGLMAAAVRPEYLKTARQIYKKKADWSTVEPSTNPDEGLPGLPSKPIDMLTGAFIDAYNSGQGKFYRKVVQNTALKGLFTEPSRFYGGGGDNVVPTWSSITMPVDHQQQLGSNLSMGINVSPDATNRSTFVDSLFGPQSILDWFNAA